MKPEQIEVGKSYRGRSAVGRARTVGRIDGKRSWARIIYIEHGRWGDRSGSAFLVNFAKWAESEVTLIPLDQEKI